MKLTDADLSSLDQWAACDLGPNEGRRVAALIEEVRAARAELERIRPVYEAAVRWRGTWSVRLEDLDSDDETLCRAIDSARTKEGR